MNYKIAFDPAAQTCRISKTGEAVGTNVAPSLKIARGMLEMRVGLHLSSVKARLKDALRVRDADLPTESATPTGATGAVGAEAA